MKRIELHKLLPTAHGRHNAAGRLLLLTLLLFTFVGGARADKFEFWGTEDDKWSNLNNWKINNAAAYRLPGEDDEVFICADCSMDRELEEDYYVAKITVEKGILLSIEDYFELGTVILEDGAQFYPPTDEWLVLSCEATIKKTIKPFELHVDDYSWLSNNWHLLSIPVNVPEVTPQKKPDEKPFYDYAEAGLLDYQSDFYIYNHFYFNNEWRNYRCWDNENGSFVAEYNGYLYASPVEHELSFTGKLYTLAEKEYSYLRYDSLGPNFREAGFNIVGNPYPCNAKISFGGYEYIGTNRVFINSVFDVYRLNQAGTAFECIFSCSGNESDLNPGLILPPCAAIVVNTSRSHKFSNIKFIPTKEKANLDTFPGGREMNYLFPPGHFFTTNRNWGSRGHDNDLPYLSLKNDEGNDFTGYNNEAINVMLDGRTIYCDGEWNTLCLPFNIVQFEGTPLEGFTVMELDVENEYNYHKTGFDNGTLYLNFKNVTSIDAGKPYIVKKEANNINNPMFSWVRINFDTPMPVTSEDGAVSFIGNYSPVSLAQNDTSVLYLGAQDGESYLYYPNEDMSIGSARAYFKLNNGITVGQFDGARLFFGDETSGISTITSLSMKGDKWFDLLGHQLQGKPTRKGLYIHEGRKTVVN